MKILGVVGGISPESTIEYYRLIVAESVPVVITSIDLDRLIALMNANDLDTFTTYIADEVQRLARAGAEIGLIAAHTPHIVFDEIQRRSPIPLVSIVEATIAEVRARGMKRVALLGTRFTMQGGFYKGEGIEIITPNADEQTVIHAIYLGELVKGVIRPESRRNLLAIIDDIHQREAIDGVILGGTELPLILRDGDHAVPFLDTTRIHVRAALERFRAL